MAEFVSSTHKGGCFCGAVTYEYCWDSEESKPVFAAYCHCQFCRSSRSVSAADILGVPIAAFKITAGEENLKQYKPSSGKVHKSFCITCGSTILQVCSKRIVFGLSFKLVDLNLFPPSTRSPCKNNRALWVLLFTAFSPQLWRVVPRNSQTSLQHSNRFVYCVYSFIRH